MRILILNWKHPCHPTAGGAELYVDRLATHLQTMGHTVVLLVPEPPRHLAADLPTFATSYRLLVLPTNRVLLSAGSRSVRTGARIIDSLAFFARARAYLRHNASLFDTVVESVSTRPFFANDIVPGGAAMLYHQGADELWSQEFSPPVSWIGRWIVEPSWLRRMRSARVIAVSPSTEASLAIHRVPVIAVIPPGVDVPPRPRPRALGTAPRLLFLGRLVSSKRPFDALEAFSSVQRVIPGATLDIVGDGYLRAELRSRAPRGVTVHGFVDSDRKAELLRQADVMLIPGTREGWGIVALEAAAAGTPVVGYRIPGLWDSVLDGCTGILTQANPEAMATATLELLADSERWSRLSTAATARAEAYSWGAVAARWLAVLNQGRPGMRCTVPETTSLAEGIP